MSAVQFMEEWFEEVWNKGDASHIDRCLADTCDINGLAATKICCPADFHQFHQAIIGGFANLHCTVLRAIESGDEVAGYVKVTATHRQTRRPVEFHTSFIATVKDGKLCDVQNTVDFLDVLIQVGAVPSDIMDKTL